MKWPDGHLTGRAISATTYRRYGCRCEGCRELANAATTTSIERRPQIRASQRAYNRARHRAMQRLTKRHPDEYALLLREERRAVGLTSFRQPN